MTRHTDTRLPDSWIAPVPGASHRDEPIPAAHLADLQIILRDGIPSCDFMQFRVIDAGSRGLALSMPFEANRNHQETGFAGSINSLCTMTGWGNVYLLLRKMDTPARLVIRRSRIKYHLPVVSDEIVAYCKPPQPEALDYFSEMLLAF